jgi:cell division transport system permease protein
VSVVGEDRSPIGISSIWGEGEGLDRVSATALAGHCVRQAYENIRRSSLTSALTVITIAVAIFLLGIFFLGVHNAARAVSAGRGDISVMVFLKDGVSSADVEALSTRLRGIAGQNSSISYVDKAAALNYFRESLGDDAAVLDGLESDNPLPASLNIQVSSPDQAEALHGAVSTALKGAAAVESVRYTRGGVRQIRKMIRLIQVIGAVGLVFLFIIAGFIIANTIKLALYNHRVEVEIMQLVGARRGSIYVPYLLEGLVQGVLGATFGLLGVLVVFLVARGFFAQAELLSLVFPTFNFIPLWYCVGTLLAGAAVGVIGSFLAVRRFLAETF